MIYVGSYQGIWVFDADLRPVAEPVRVHASTFLASHPRLPVLYACVEADDGAFIAYRIGASGELSPLGEQASGGAEPIHLAVSPDGDHLLCATWGDGSVAVLPLDPEGRIGPATDVVTYPKPTAHHVSITGTEVTVVHFAMCALYGYALEPPGRLRPTWTADAGRSGPRHLATHPSGRRYVADEHSSTLSTYVPDAATGALRRVSAVPATTLRPAEENHPSEVVVSPDGRFVYVANRGADTIAVFEASEEPVLVAEVPTGGGFPRHFALADERLYVANEGTNSVTVLPLVDGIPQPNRPARSMPHARDPARSLSGAAVDVTAPTCILRYR